MVKDREIEKAVRDVLDSDNYFIVGIQNKQDTIKVIVDGYKGIDLEKCGEITRNLRSSFGEKVDDYNIEVTSPGLTSPFQVIEQYKKNIGQKVETLLKTGEKITGKLQEVNPDSILLEEKKRIKTDKNKKKTVREEKTIKFDEIKYTKLIISF
ncbi:MAG: ribosome assembly cofactor RimP [Bacteroidota bacterium]